MNDKDSIKDTLLCPKVEDEDVEALWEFTEDDEE